MESSNTPIAPHPSHQQRGSSHVVLLGFLTLSIAIAAFIWLRGSASSPQEQVRSMPSGSLLLAGADIEHVVTNNWVQGVLDNPMVRLALSAAKDKSGIDIKQLNSAKGGLWFVDGAPHVLMVIQGQFDTSKIHGSMKSLATGKVDIGDYAFFAVSEFQNLTESTGKEGDATTEKTDGVTEGDVVAGLVDDNELVVGHLGLVKQYVDGDTGDDETRAAQVENIDSSAAAWMIGNTEKLASVFPKNDALEQFISFGNISYVGTLHLDLSLRMTLSLTASSESDAQKLEMALTLLSGMSGAVDALPFGLGESGVKPEVTRADNKVTVQLKVDLPKKAPL